MNRPLLAMLALSSALSLARPPDTAAFCGFYVGKADASLYNEASQVVLVRNENRTVISMMNDYKGELTEFALVVPVPVVLQKGQIHIGDRKLFERIDGYSAPRLVEYHDPDPCDRVMYESMAGAARPSAAPMSRSRADRAKSLGVTIEAEYTIGEYDIVILSAKESDGLETWLVESGYRIPKGASRALQPYIRQKLKFFVAKVNLKEQKKTGLKYLRPLQFAFESPKFMLPIRLGMVNATGPQDLLLYVITKNGRVETTNYRTVKLPSDMDIPVHVKDEFADFYKAMFEHQHAEEDGRVVFTEYFWNMNWCDPCASDPLTPEELRKLGVFWLGRPEPQPKSGMPLRPMPPMPGAVQAMVTRLHVRYAPDTFPEDLVFQETGDQQNYQARYVLRHAWKGDADKCEEAKRYLESLDERQEKEAETLADLTGWEIADIRKKMDLGDGDGGREKPTKSKWWEGMWE